MKYVLVLALAALLTLAGCGASAGDAELSEPRVWLDYRASCEDMPWDEVQELELPEDYPGVVFRWTASQVSAAADGEEEALFSGMPVWSVFLADLSGDGRPELCANVSFGSGMVDDRVLVYDYAAGALYTLEDRGYRDYTLALEEGRLTVTERDYPSWPPGSGGEGATGILALTADSSGETVLRMVYDET